MAGFLSLMRKIIRTRGSVPDLAKLYQGDLTELRTNIDQIRSRIRQTNRDVFFNATGQALTVWARMEEQLVVIVAILLPAMTNKAGLVMYSIINFQVWLTVIDELFSLEAKYSAFRPRWNKIAEKLRREKDYRDRLAHHPISQESEGMALSKPPRLDTRQKSKAFTPLTLAQATDFAARVASIAEDLQKLTEDMTDFLERSGSPENSAEPSRDQSP